MKSRMRSLRKSRFKPVHPITKQLIGSVISMLVIMSMYSVTIYAWLGVSVSNVGSRIQAGRYEYTAVYHVEGGTDQPMTDGKINQVFTQDKVYITVVNTGTADLLDFKYIFEIGADCNITITDITDEHEPEAIGVIENKTPERVLHKTEHHSYEITFLQPEKLLDITLKTTYVNSDTYEP